MTSDYWEEIWNESSLNNVDVRYVSGWGERTFQEMLYVISDTASKLNLKYNDKFLDIGCGSGIFEIAFAPWLKEIFAVDYAKEMVEVALKNTSKYENIKIQESNIKELPFKNDYFNKILVSSVIQYLNNFDEVKKTFKELWRVTGKNGRILISMNPDASKKEEYIDGYYKLDFSETIINEKLKATNQALWFEKNYLKEIGEDLGFKAELFKIDSNVWQSKYYFDLLLIKE